MSQFVKDVLADVRKSVINFIVMLLGTALLGASATEKWWSSLLKLSESQASSLRYWLLFIGAIALIIVGGHLYFLKCRKLRLVEQQLEDARKRPHPFQDDCSFDERVGVYRHKSKPGFFCASCTPKDVESPLLKTENGWLCQVKECQKFHSDPDNPPKPAMPDTPTRRTSLNGL